MITAWLGVVNCHCDKFGFITAVRSCRLLIFTRDRSDFVILLSLSMIRQAKEYH